MIPEGVVQISLWFQLLLWMYLYNSKIHFDRILEPIYYLAGFTTLFLVYVNQTAIYFFSTKILMQYIALILLATQIYNSRFEFKQAVCLAFLTVFLNSFYWEFFYHVYEFQIWLPYSLGWEWWYNRIPQWLRLVPAFWFTHNFNITDTKALRVGLVISFIFTYMRFVWRVQSWIHPIHRVICLLLLVYTIISSTPKREKEDG